MNYAPKPYYRVSMNRKRQIIDATLDELHNMQLDMIDQAVEYSDLKEAQEIIDWIRKL
jgi:glutathionylspermidine synthase